MAKLTNGIFLLLLLGEQTNCFQNSPQKHSPIRKLPLNYLLSFLVTGKHALGRHRPRFQRGLFGSVAKGLKLDNEHLGTAVYNKRSPLENRESIFLSDLQGHFHDCYLI